MVRVKGLANVTCSGYNILPGVITEVPEDVANALGPAVQIIGRTEPTHTVNAAVVAPPVDKMLKNPPKAKGRGRAKKNAIK
jgi:hypothetical protein